ncbi:MAG: VanZ family protein [Xanthomonadaceae bacterium]|nr:VanZ family protein [Xanthomonadaceae bacterium]
MLKPFRRPHLWMGLWLCAIAAVVVVCLIPPPPLPEIPQGGDKVEHFAAYFILAAAAVQIFAKRGMCRVAAVFLVLLGIGIEFAQGALTVTRMADPWDALANACGAIAGMATLWTPWRDMLLRREPWRGS